MSLVIAAHPLRDLYKIGLPARAVKVGGEKKCPGGASGGEEASGAVAAEGGHTDLLTERSNRLSPA